MCFCTSTLRKAIQKGDLNEVQLLLDQAGESAPDYINEDYTSNCIFDCLRKNPVSILHTAINHGHWEVAYLLLDYGADVNSRGFWYQTPLHVACRQHNLVLAKNLIIKHGADLFVRDDIGQYPLHSACLLVTDDHFVKDMYSEGFFKPSDVVLPDYNGNTALHVAAYRDNVFVLSYLMDMGVNILLTNNQGQSAIDVAKPAAKAVLGQQ